MEQEKVVKVNLIKIHPYENVIMHPIRIMYANEYLKNQGAIK